MNSLAAYKVAERAVREYVRTKIPEGTDLPDGLTVNVLKVDYGPQTDWTAEAETNLTDHIVYKIFYYSRVPNKVQLQAFWIRETKMYDIPEEGEM